MTKRPQRARPRKPRPRPPEDRPRGPGESLLAGVEAVLEADADAAQAGLAALKSPEVRRLQKQAEPLADRLEEIVAEAELADSQARSEYDDLKRLRSTIAEDMAEALGEHD